MKRFIVVVGTGLLAVSLSLSAFAHNGEDHSKNKKSENKGKPVTIVGELLDSACFTSSGGESKGKDHADCAKSCMASGIPAAILPEGSKGGNPMLFLLTNPTVLAPYAAQTIKVEGTGYVEKHAIDVKKLYVKDGDGWKEVQLKDEHHGSGDDKAADKHADHKHGEHK